MRLTQHAAAYTTLRKRRVNRPATWTDVARAYDAGLIHALHLSTPERHRTLRLVRVLFAANREVTES